MGIIYDLAMNTRKAIDNLAENVSDKVALKSKQFYRTWEELCNYNNGEGFTAEKAGFRFTYGDDLYKTVQPNQHFESQWVTQELTRNTPEPWKIRSPFRRMSPQMHLCM